MEEPHGNQAGRAPILYTKDTLAALLGITEGEAQRLMESDTFPETPITGKTYAVTPDNLKAWARLNARRVDGVNAGDVFKNL